MSLYRQSLLVLALLLPSIAAQAQSWTIEPDMKLKRSEAAAVDYNGQLYVFNGFSKGLFIGNSVEKYNPANKQWSMLSTTSVAIGTAVSHTGTVVIGNEAWLIGGRIGAHPGHVSDKVWIYNLDTNRWRTGPKLPVPMAGGGAALVNNKIYLFGGMDSQARCDVNFHYVYNLSNPAAGWANITATAGMPEARNHFSTVVINDTIYAIGGQHNHDGCPGTPGGNVALVHSYHPQTNTWEKLASLPAIESHNEPSTFVHNGFIYTVGGATAGDKVLRYDVGTDQWEHIVDLPEPLLAPVARIFNGRLVVAGGGAPITSKSITTVRSIGLNKFNDLANNQSSTNNTNTTSTASSTNGLVVIEAENYQSKIGAGSHHWVNSTYPDASANQSMITTANNGTLKSGAIGSPRLSYNVSFTEPGSYHVWIRGWGDENSGSKNDSIHAGLNNTLSPTADKIDGFPTGWHWSKRTRDGANATINVATAGSHTFNLWMREDGFAVDKIILTKDASYTPTGLNAGDDQSTTTTNNTSNTAPVVNAGASASIMESASLSLNGSASDDGLPTASNLTLLWSKTAGPGTAVFSNTSKATTSVSFSASGTYELALTANDGELTSTNTITVTVNADTTDTDTDIGDSQTYAVEAESFFIRTATPSHQWVNANLAGASENASMITTPNKGALTSGSAAAPMMGYMINFTEPGKYYLWIRGWGDETSNGVGHNDSIHAGLNGTLPNTADKIDGFPTGWHWSQRTRDGSPATLNVPTAGIHTVNLWMREDGLAIDKLILSKDADYVPTGTGTTGSSITTTSTNEPNSNTTTTSQSSTNNNNYIANATRAWQMVQTANGSAVTARHEAAAVAIDDTLFIMGGRGNRQTQSYSLSSNTWASHGKTPVRMHHFQPVAIGDTIYAIGAMKDDNFPTEESLEHVYMFDTNSLSWSKGVAIPDNRLRGSVGAAVYNGKIYLVGGNTNGHSGPAVKWFDEYDPVTEQWRTMPDAPTARDHMTVAVADGKLIVAAGRRSQHPNTIGDTEATTDMFNFSTNQWETTAENIPTKRAGTMTVAVGGEVVVIGGESIAHVASHDEVEALNVSTGKWRTLQPLMLGRHSGGAAVVDGKIHVVSGNTTRGGGNETINHETLRLDTQP